MGRAIFASLALAGVLALSARPAVADLGDDGHVVDAWTPNGAADASLLALAGRYTGFGASATGGEGRPVYTVTELADSGSGSLRGVLEAAARLGGGRIVFAVGGDVELWSGLTVPANTTIDGLAAPAPGVTLWGDRLPPGGGVLEIGAGNVVVRGLRIRNAVNDGIQIAAKHGRAIARVVVDHCSITNSGDGGVDVTGSAEARVSDVTLSWNYLAANGGACASKGWCGGGSLVKYGVARVSVHGNVWDKNLRRNPSIDGDTLADVRGNVVRGYVESGTQLRNGATGNVVGNFFAGARPLLTTTAAVFAAGNEGATAVSVATPFDVADPLGIVTGTAVLASAGAPPTDAIDLRYRDELATFEAAKDAVVPGLAPAPGAPAGLTAATPPLDPATLAAARVGLRAARRARLHGDRTAAAAGYEAGLALLTGAHGLYARPAAAVGSDAALALSALALPDRSAAVVYARTAEELARQSGDGGRHRRAQRRLRQLMR